MTDSTSPATPDFSHDPVMLAEVTAVMADVPDGYVVDATVGGGGHATMLLSANDRVRVIGLDQDDHALAAARTRLAPHGDRVTLLRRRFDGLTDEMARLGIHEISGCLFDLGVSSPQLDRADRGFSFRHDGPLDMRMDRRSPTTAADLVNTLDEQALATMLRRNGDEPHARRIARALVAARPIATTAELADVIREAVPAAARRKGGHPARRSFQALRIEVNHELDILDDALCQALALLAPEGRCAVLAYHSGEDRIVKQRFRDAAGSGPACGPTCRIPRTTAPTSACCGGARTPSAAEIAENPAPRRPGSGQSRSSDWWRDGIAACGPPGPSIVTSSRLPRVERNLRVVRPEERARSVGALSSMVAGVFFVVLLAVAGLHGVLVQTQAEIDRLDADIATLDEQRMNALADRAWAESPEGLAAAGPPPASCRPTASRTSRPCRTAHWPRPMAPHRSPGADPGERRPAPPPHQSNDKGHSHPSGLRPRPGRRRVRGVHPRDRGLRLATRRPPADPRRPARVRCRQPGSERTHPRTAR
ncbi:MAG: 16S rRNA (cytosine(1402)-N(4))-methyltransferase RsmH [Acidimicrobiales bacterium]